jgi:hypothetical protein
MKKNRIFMFVLILGITTLLSSCLDLMIGVLDQPQTHKILLNEYTPVEQNVTLTYIGALMMKQWNGSDMQNILKDKLDKNKKIYPMDKIILTLPAGNNSFTLDAYVIFDKSTTYTSYRVPNVQLSYVFEAGKSYEIRTRSKSLGKSKGFEFFIGVYDGAKRSTLLQEWKIGEGQ